MVRKNAPVSLAREVKMLREAVENRDVLIKGLSVTD